MIPQNPEYRPSWEEKQAANDKIQHGIPRTPGLCCRKKVVHEHVGLIVRWTFEKEDSDSSASEQNRVVVGSGMRGKKSLDEVGYRGNPDIWSTSNENMN